MEDFAQWLEETLLWIPRKLWAELLDALASFVEAIPPPDFLVDASAAFSGISGNIAFFASKLAVAEGLAMVLSAYVLRFILRRIPFIG